MAVGRGGHGRIVHPRSTCGRAVAPLGSPPMSTTEQPTTADDVKAHRRRARHPLHPLLVHRHPRPAQVVLDQRGRARRRLRGRDGLRRLLDHRLQRDRGVGHDRHARRRRRSRCCPWRPDEQGVGADVLRHPHARAHALRGRPAPRPAPRARARRARWASTPSTSAPSSSTSCSRTRTSTEVLDEGGYFDLTTLDAGSDVRRETVLALEQLGIHVEYTHHEVGPSQHEIDMRYADALKMADDCMTYRITVKEYAMKYGWHATFMPKPLFGENGSGMHTHMSAVQRGQERVLRRRRRVLPLRRRQGVHRRPAQARARDLARSSPSG